MAQKTKAKVKISHIEPKKGSDSIYAASQKRRFVLGLIVGMLGFVLYSNTFSHGYVLDDFSAIKENNIVRQGFKAIPEIFNTSYRQGYLSVKDGLYRPLSLTTYAIEWELFPDQPGVSHFANAVLYSLTGFLLFQMLAMLFSLQQSSKTNNLNETIAFLASLLFIAHPLHVEVVANIKSRDEILCFLLVLVSFIYVFKYVAIGGKKYLLVAMLSFFLSLLSKETSITFLALLPLSLHFFSTASLKKNLALTSIFLGTFLTYLLIRNHVLQGAIADSSVSIADNLLVGAKTLNTHLGTAFYILGLYVKMHFFPHPMSYDYSFNQIEIVGLTNIFSILSILFFICLSSYAVFILYKSFKNRTANPFSSIVAFGILFFLITLFLFSNLVLTIGTSMGDRLMYFPSLGFCIVIAALLSKLPAFQPSLDKNNKNIIPFGNLGIGIALLIILPFSIKAYARNKDWKDNFTLYAHDVKIVPNSVKAHYYLGLELIKVQADAEQDPNKKKAFYEEGILELEKAVAILPTFSSAYTQMGVAFYRLKNFEKAIENYNKASSLKPQDAITLNNIGTVYFEWGKYNEAAEKFSNAIQIDSRFVDAYMNLGSVYGTLNNYDKAIESFNSAIKNAPDNARAYYYIAMTYQNKGDKINADKYYKIAASMDPKFAIPK